MKKHLIAAAVAAAVAVPAMAQVTVSGTLDAGLVSRDSGNATANKYTGGAGNVLTTSTIRFAGTEDLGGGLKASFTILDEYQLHSSRAATVAVDSDVSVAAPPFAAVDQYSMAVSGGFGSVEIGRFSSMARSVNGAGSVIGNVGLPGNYGANTVVAALGNVGVVAAGDRTSMRGLGNYNNNSFAYTTPTLSGVTAQFYRTMSQRSADDVGQTDAAAIRYAAGPLTVGYSSIRQATTAAGAKRETTAATAQYDAGLALLGFGMVEHDESSAVAGGDGKVLMLTARIPLGNGINVLGGYHAFEDENAATQNKGTATILGATKDLSKRTNVYAVYARVSNENNSSYHLGIHDIGVSTPGNDPRSIAVGVRHSF